ILGIGKGILRVFSLDFPLLGTSPIPVICSIILTSDFPLLEAEVALINTSSHCEYSQQENPVPITPSASKKSICYDRASKVPLQQFHNAALWEGQPTDIPDQGIRFDKDGYPFEDHSSPPSS
ncbi:hypothetical protein L208DRAFT_1338487, partial [Tricholoma matsutake]